jgi:hypothetical protein
MITRFEEFIAPFDADTFFSDYWNKSFLRLAGQTGKFSDLLRWDEIADIIQQHRLQPPRFRLFDGQAHRLMDRNRYMVAGIDGNPRVDAGKLVACLSQGATMILDCVEEMAPRVKRLARDFQETLGAGNYVGLYAVWPSPYGLDLHWDAEDLFIMQISGRKRWQIYRPTRDYPLQEDLQVAPEPVGAPVWDGMLEDGDALYIPRGWWHKAYPADVPSLHLTLGTVPPHGYNLLQWLIRRLRSEVAIRRDIPLLRDRKAKIELVNQLRELLNSLLNDQLVDEFRDEWESDFRPIPHINLPSGPLEQTQEPDERYNVRLASANRLHIEIGPDGKTATFKACNTLWACPVTLLPALKALIDREAKPLPELFALLPDNIARANLRNSLMALAKAGVVTLERRSGG